jgi:hypothetical protein
MTKTTLNIETHDDQDEPFFNTLIYLRRRKEPLSAITRSLFMKIYYHEYLLSILLEEIDKTQVGMEALGAIASARRSLAQDLANLDLAELRCKRLMGMEVSVEPHANGNAEAIAPEVEAKPSSLKDGW